MMSRGFCNVSVAPVRADHSDRAEMITQVLYGEGVDIIEVRNNWTLIKLHYDGYEGWVDTKQVTALSEEAFSQRKLQLVTECFKSYTTQDGEVLLSMGAEIPRDSVVEENSIFLRESIVERALKFINVPYLWGGKSFFGIDCSGFTQLVFKMNQIKLPRDAYQQAEIGEALTFVVEAQAGDLAFFENDEGKIIHVGIMLDNHRIIHAHGKVRIDIVDSVGIFNKQQNKHTHKLRFIRNIID